MTEGRTHPSRFCSCSFSELQGSGTDLPRHAHNVFEIASSTLASATTNLRCRYSNQKILLNNENKKPNPEKHCIQVMDRPFKGWAVPTEKEGVRKNTKKDFLRTQ